VSPIVNYNEQDGLYGRHSVGYDQLDIIVIIVKFVSRFDSTFNFLVQGHDDIGLHHIIEEGARYDLCSFPTMSMIKSSVQNSRGTRHNSMDPADLPSHAKATSTWETTRGWVVPYYQAERRGNFKEGHLFLFGTHMWDNNILWASS
jgi:hypothetical protein